MSMVYVSYIKIIPIITMTIMIPMINPNMHPIPFATPLKKLMIINFLVNECNY